MSDYCPHCDDFSMDSSRAKKKPVVKLLTKESVTKKTKKIVINVDNSDENADWIKRVKTKRIRVI